MSRPRYVLVGVPKAGTTSLHRYLRQHPQVNVSRLEEVNFLSYPGRKTAKEQMPRLAFPVTTLEQYDELFAGPADQVSVDFSASCFRSPVAVERIRTYITDPRLLVLLRDPTERAYSAYLHRVRKGYETRPPEEALVRGEHPVEMGFYAERIDELMREFGADRVRVWLLDDLSADPHGTLREVFGYLGVDPNRPVESTEVHNRGSLPRNRLVQRMLPKHNTRRVLARSLPMSVQRPVRWLLERNQRPPDDLPADIEAKLRVEYADDIIRLEQLTGHDLDAWLPPDRRRSPRPTPG